MKHLQKQKGGVGGRKLGRSRAFYSLLLTTLVAIAIYNSFAFFQKSEGNSILNYNRKNIQEKKKDSLSPLPRSNTDSKAFFRAEARKGKLCRKDRHETN